MLIDRDQGCGALLSELPLAPDGTPGTPVRLTAEPLARRHGFDVLALGGRTPALVTRTAANRVAVARATAGAPFAAPVPVALPPRASLATTTVLRDGRLVLAFTRSCRPGSHVADALVQTPDGRLSGAMRLGRCGDPSPALVDRTGRAVFVGHRGGDLVAWATVPVGSAQRSGR